MTAATAELPARDRPQAAQSRCSGINFVGYLSTESGVGQAGRSYVRALRSLGVPVALQDLSPLQTNRSLDTSLCDASDDGALHNTNIVCADVELHYAIADYLGDDFFRDRYNIAIWA